MRAYFLAFMLPLLPTAFANSADPAPTTLDKQLFDTLKDLHNRGADMFNGGEAIGAYRLFQGTLLTTRAVLTHRPDEQKFIDDALSAVERLPTIDDRAFALHKTIENLRNRLKPPVAKDGITPELLLPPREPRVPPKPEPPMDPELLLPPREQKVPPKPEPPKDGVMGQLMWQGKPVEGARVLFIAKDTKEGGSAETDSDGRYTIRKLPPGKYTVVLPLPNGRSMPFPDRYLSRETSPLIVEVKEGGDTVDFLLQ